MAKIEVKKAGVASVIEFEAIIRRMPANDGEQEEELARWMLAPDAIATAEAQAEAWAATQEGSPSVLQQLSAVATHVAVLVMHIDTKSETGEMSRVEKTDPAFYFRLT